MRPLVHAMMVSQIASPLLVKLWEEKGSWHDRDYYTEGTMVFFADRLRAQRGFALMFTAGALLTAVIVKAGTETTSPVALSVTGLIGLVFAFVFHAVYLFYTKKADEKFTSDCTGLWNLFCQSPGQINSVETLRSLAKEKLIDKAKHLLRHQNNPLRTGEDSESNILSWQSRLQEFKGKFKSAHELLLRFKLVEGTWNLYFDEARKQLAEEKRRHSSPAPTT